MIALTLPILFPIVVNLGHDPVRFCVIAMKMNEVAGVSPPVGLNAFGLAGPAGKEVRVEHVYRCVLPFIMCHVAVLIILITMPQIVVFLPNRMFN